MTYDFRCKCGYEISVMAKITDTVTPPICVACRQEMKRIYEVNAIQFKGEGFASNEP